MLSGTAEYTAAAAASTTRMWVAGEQTSQDSPTRAIVALWENSQLRSLPSAPADAGVAVHLADIKSPGPRRTRSRPSCGTTDPCRCAGQPAHRQVVSERHGAAQRPVPWAAVPADQRVEPVTGVEHPQPGEGVAVVVERADLGPAV